jgi:hypothetical protein
MCTRPTGESPISWVVVAMAASSLFSMICLLQVDGIVDSELFIYGLRASSSYVPYSNMIRVAFILGWFNIIAAIGVHLYSITFRRKEVEQLVIATEEEMRRRRVEQLRRLEEPPILPGLPERESLSKAELEPEREALVASAQS